MVEIPRELQLSLKLYREDLTRPQFNQFRKLITGLIVSDNKTIQEINDCFGDTNQSSLNRFLTESRWNEEAIERTRLSQLKKLSLQQGTLVIDPTMLHKTGRHMEKANYHYSGTTKKKEWGHLLVDSFFSDGENDFPVSADIYLREVDADKDHPFRTMREIALEQVNYALKNQLPVKTIIFDAGLYASKLLEEIKRRKLKYIAGIGITNKFSIDGEKRVNAKEYLNTITDLNFSRHIISGEVYHLHAREIYTRGVGKEKLLISYKDGDEENIKLYSSNIFDKSDEELICLLLRRWDIEVLHRDAKQHLGLEDYQVRKFGAVQKVVRAVLVAYTQLVLSAKHRILEPLQRGLKTIGERCRFFRLIALKGMKWLKKKARNISDLREVMNNFVFVKNAKV